MNKRKLKILKHELFKNKQALLSLLFLMLIIIFYLTALLTKVNPEAINLDHKFLKPSSEFWFGTDGLGRDYFARIAYGGKVSLLVGILAMLSSTTIGVAIGTVSGYKGGTFDFLTMRFIDIISSIPWLILVTVISIFLKRGLFSIIFVIGCFTWMQTAKIIRAQTLSIKEREYVQYAKFLGTPDYKVIIKHIIPTLFSTIVTSATNAIATAILIESSLSFFGIGIQQPLASWGSLLSDAQKYIKQSAYMGLIPGILIILTIASFNKLGEVLIVAIELQTLDGAK